MSRARLRLFALLFALLALFTACSGDDDDDGGSDAAGDDTQEAAAEETTTTLPPEDALAGASKAAVELPAQVEQWQAGDLGDDDMRRAARRALVAAGDARDAVATMEDSEESKPLAVGAAELYFQHASLVLEAVNLQDGPAREEAAGLALEIGVLAARALEWAAYVQHPGAAEPPRPLPGDTEAPLDRPTQPEADWVAALEELAVPPTLDQLGDPAAQETIFRDAATAMGEEADPDTPDGHLTSARLRLDWLVKAVSCKAARLGLTGTSAPLVEIELAVPSTTETTEAEPESPEDAD